MFFEAQIVQALYYRLAVVQLATGDCDFSEHFLKSTNRDVLEVGHYVFRGKVRNKIAHCSKHGSVQRVRLPCHKHVTDWERRVSGRNEHCQQLIVNCGHDLRRGVKVDVFGDLQHVKLPSACIWRLLAAYKLPASATRAPGAKSATVIQNC